MPTVRRVKRVPIAKVPEATTATIPSFMIDL